MSQYIIKMKDGIPFEHPMILENFVQCFPEVDLENLPNTFAYFEKTAKPVLGPYQEILSGTPEYVVREDGTVTEQWLIRAYSTEERQRLVDMVMSYEHFNSWTFNETTCSYEPPIPYPTDGNSYVWDEVSINWVLRTVNIETD